MTHVVVQVTKTGSVTYWAHDGSLPVELQEHKVISRFFLLYCVVAGLIE